MSTVAAAPRTPPGTALPPLMRAHRPLIALAVVLVGIAVVLSPHWWAEAWSLSGVSAEYLGLYATAWAPFGLLALLVGWRGLLSPWMAAAALPILAAVTLRALEAPAGSVLDTAPAVLCAIVLILWGVDVHVRLRAGDAEAPVTPPLALSLCLLVALVVGGGRLGGVDSVAELETFTVIFASIAVEALPFVLLGALVSGLIEVFVSDRAFERVSRLPLRLQVPGLALCGMAMPVCECGSVPVARRLILRGVHPGAGVAFMLAAPILNPVVLFSTWVAYSGDDPLLMVAARAGLGLVLATASGLLIARMGAGRLLARPGGHAHHHHHGEGRVRRVMDHLSADFFFMGKFVIAGAALAAAMQTLVPQDVFTGVLTTPLVGAALLMAFAFLLSLCSEADAFVAISFVQFPIGAQLAFLVFGPVLDIKLALLYAATFGWAFVARLAVITIPIVLGGSMLVQAVAG
jgi:uncharacterized membrane protein YraQ (UPF0718 family)